MKDYKLSEIKKMCAENANGECIDCPIFIFCSLGFQGYPKNWKIDKIEDGTLVRLPCKVGDIVYIIKSDCVLCGKVSSFKISDDFLSARAIVGYDDYFIFTAEDFGETIFFTEAEAEKRLKELQEEER